MIKTIKISIIICLTLILFASCTIQLKNKKCADSLPSTNHTTTVTSSSATQHKINGNSTGKKEKSEISNVSDLGKISDSSNTKNKTDFTIENERKTESFQDSSINLNGSKYGIDSRHGISPICWFYCEEGVIQWARNCTINGEKWSLHNKLITHLQTYRKIIVPKLKNKKFKYYTGNACEESINQNHGAYIVIYKTEEENKLYFGFLSLDSNENFESFIKKTFNYTKCRVTKVEEKCKWGDCFLIKDPSSTRIAFEVENFVVTASFNDDWKPEYFNYFDFETVSLKD